MNKLPFLLLTALILSTPCTAAVSKENNTQPNWEADALYGVLRLPNAPTERFTTIEAGGDREVNGLGHNCAGFVNFEKPDVDINFAEDSEPGDKTNKTLTIAAQATADTSLVVYTSNSEWLCADDTSDSDSNPRLVFRNTEAGGYNVWVASPEKGGGEKVKLTVTVY